MAFSTVLFIREQVSGDDGRSRISSYTMNDGIPAEVLMRTRWVSSETNIPSPSTLLGACDFLVL